MTTMTGRCSTFGGPADTGMSITEGLALVRPNDLARSELHEFFIHPVDYRRGLGRQLNPLSFYCAMRWNYAKHGGYAGLQKLRVMVKANGRSVIVRPVDWGPATWTGRVIDLSPGAAKKLGVVTDDVVTVLIGE